MKADLAITEVQNFIEHLISTAHYVKSLDEQLGCTSTDDMLSQTWEIAFESYEVSDYETCEHNGFFGQLAWGTKDEETYGKIFDSIQDKLSEIVA